VSAALEFGVIALGVRDVVVLGHASCGGVRAFADETKPLSPSDFIGRWMAQIEPAARRLDPPSADAVAWLRRLEMAAIELSLENLMTFPWIAARVRDGRLALHGAYFGIAEGRLLVRDPVDGSFKPLAERDSADDGAPA
jgi:carbonic anhydrase